MRYVKYLFLATLGIVLITLALANTMPVTVALLPAGLADLTGLSAAITLPLFVVIFAAIICGLLIGFVWEYLREYKHRSEASRQRRENAKLSKEVESLKVQKARDEGDEVLALLED